MAKEVVEFPIPGKVLSVNVKEGDSVAEGGTLCILESMKMENPILAPVSGKVVELKVSAGQMVQSGDRAAVIEY